MRLFHLITLFVVMLFMSIVVPAQKTNSLKPADYYQLPVFGKSLDNTLSGEKS
jgi:hypothetical protein